MSNWEWMHREEACKFYGGPLHGRVLMIRDTTCDYHYVYPTEVYWMRELPRGWVPDEEVTIQLGIYRPQRETFIVRRRPFPPIWKYCFVFSGLM